MTIKPAVQKILEGFLHTVKKYKLIHEAAGKNKLH